MSLRGAAGAHSADRAAICARYQQLMAAWRDEVAGDFDRGCWQPVLRAVQELEEAMNRLADTDEGARNHVP